MSESSNGSLATLWSNYLSVVEDALAFFKKKIIQKKSNKRKDLSKALADDVIADPMSAAMAFM